MLKKFTIIKLRYKILNNKIKKISNIIASIIYILI